MGGDDGEPLLSRLATAGPLGTGETGRARPAAGETRGRNSALVGERRSKLSWLWSESCARWEAAAVEAG